MVIKHLFIYLLFNENQIKTSLIIYTFQFNPSVKQLKIVLLVIKVHL
jgi:hypothetical protein